MTDKGPAAFRTISEASAEVGVPSHVLRFWETRFSFIRPMKRAGGRRFYRPQDLDVLKGVRALLHDEGYTIKGVQKLHKEAGVGRVLVAGHGGADGPAAAARVNSTSAQSTGDDAQPDLFTPASESAPEPRFVLDAAARARLDAVLADLERVKARIDALLPAPPQA